MECPGCPQFCLAGYKLLVPNLTSNHRSDNLHTIHPRQVENQREHSLWIQTKVLEYKIEAEGELYPVLLVTHKLTSLWSGFKQ